jgi:hypothetical protein
MANFYEKLFAVDTAKGNGWLGLGRTIKIKKCASDHTEIKLVVFSHEAMVEIMQLLDADQDHNLFTIDMGAGCVYQLVTSTNVDYWVVSCKPLSHRLQVGSSELTTYDNNKWAWEWKLFEVDAS